MKAFSFEALCMFGMMFSLFLTISGVFAALLPGSMFEGIGGCLFNGLFYGLVGWLIYAVATFFYSSKPQPEIRFEPKPRPRIEIPLRIEEPQPQVQKELKI